MKELLSIMLLLFTTNLSAMNVSEEAQRIEGMLPEISEWIVENSKFDKVEKPFPKVIILRDEDFTHILNLPNADYSYYQTSNTIYVKKSNVKSYDLKIYLVHEMIHFYQIWSDYKYGCLRDLEREAYHFQEKYGQESGDYVYYKLNKNHNLWLQTYVSCDKINFNKRHLK